MKTLRYLKYLGIAVQVIQAIESLKDDQPAPFRVRFDANGRRWTLSGTLTPDPKPAR